MKEKGNKSFGAGKKKNNLTDIQSWRAGELELES